MKEQLSVDVTKQLSEGVSQDEIIQLVREVQVEHKIPESQIARLVSCHCNCLVVCISVIYCDCMCCVCVLCDARYIMPRG